MRHGAVVELLVAVSVEEEDRLAALGRVAPAPVAIEALIDTGASSSTVPLEVAESMGLRPVDSMMVEGYAGAVRRLSVFALRFLSRSGDVPIHVRAIAIPQTDRPIESVVGRDALSQCLFRYDGFHGKFDLAVLGP